MCDVTVLGPDHEIADFAIASAGEATLPEPAVIAGRETARAADLAQKPGLLVDPVDQAGAIERPWTLGT
jgi:hypothetical protein